MGSGIARRLRWLVLLGVFAIAMTACVAPILTSPPVLSGTAEIGETIASSPGGWMVGGQISYQWIRCQGDTTGCADIPGATGSTYTVAFADAGKTLRARVTNTNQFGASSGYTGFSAPVPPPTATTERLSVATDGTQANNLSLTPSISADGRKVAFTSSASNLVAGDTNSTSDIFLRNDSTDTTTRVSVASDGTQANASSYTPSISDDARWVAFSSTATNLVTGDTNAVNDVFLRDTQTGTTTRVSVGPAGAQGNNSSILPATSADGRFVAFASTATNLVAGDTNALQDVFVHDTQTATTTRVSVASGGTQATGNSLRPVISDDGRYVAFESLAANLVAGDTNGTWDVFLHDTQTSTTTRLSVASDGTQGNLSSYSTSISSDGRYVAFQSLASTLVSGDSNGAQDVFLRDTQSATTVRISVASDGTQSDGTSQLPSVSGDGRYVAFGASATNLVPGDTNAVADIMLRDTQTNSTSRLSIATDGTQGNGASDGPTVNSTGRYVAFHSTATTLVPGDTNAYQDVFLRDRG